MSPALCLMECKYCGEKDESRLMMRTEVIDGKVETSHVCLDCWWFKEINVERKNGNLLSEKKPIERSESAGASNTVSIQKRAKPKR